jgi:hypothetical protein
MNTPPRSRRSSDGVGDPAAVAQGLEAARHQGIELGQRILLVDDLGETCRALGRQAERQPGDQQGHQRGRDHGDAEQSLLAHARGRQHGHFALQVESAIGEQNTQEQSQRQDQGQEAGHAHAHDHEQRAGVEHPGSGLGQVFDEATTHDDHQQHCADGAHGQQDFTRQIAKDDQTRHSRLSDSGSPTCETRPTGPSPGDRSPPAGHPACVPAKKSWRIIL